MRPLLLAALLLVAVPCAPASADDQDAIMAQCPVAAEEARALLAEIGRTQQESLGLTGSALDRRQCQAFDSGVPAVEKIVRDLQDCRASGATRLEPTIQRMASMSAQFRSAAALVCRQGAAG